MTPDLSAEERAAEDLAQTCFCAGSTCSGCEANTKKIFLKGIAYARANPGPEVLGLVEALERLADFTESFCEEVRISKHYPSIENAREALSQWRKVRGGE